MLPLALTKIKVRRAELLLAAAAFGAEVAVAAAKPSLPVATANLELDADPSCTTRADLITRVRARSPRVRFVDDGSGLAIRVQISTTPGGAAGDVTLTSAGSKPSLRHVPAHSCNEAADAVALIIAVTLDPTADMRANTSTVVDRATAAVGAPSSANEHANKAGSAAKSGANRASPAATAQPPGANEVVASAESSGRAAFGAQLAAETFIGVAPGAMPSVALFAMARFDRPSLWSPALVLGVRHAWRTDVQEQGGSASFTLDAATLDACPVRFRLGVVEARPCGSALLGRMSARGTDTFNPAAESARPFWVVGGAAVLTADLGSLIEASGRVAVGANLVRDSFEFSPAIFHAVPPVSAAASVGIGLHWR